MAKYNPIITTKAQFIADAAAHKLYRGEVYILEDEPRLAVATSNSTYFTHVNMEDLMNRHGDLPGGNLHTAVTEESAGFMTPELRQKLLDIEYVLTTHDWSQAKVYWDNIQNKPAFTDLATAEDAPQDGKDYARKDGAWVEVDALPEQEGHVGKALFTDGTQAEWLEVITGLVWRYIDSSGTIEDFEPYQGILDGVTDSSVTVNLPTDPEEFSIVGFSDFAGVWDVYPLILDPGTNTILGDNEFIADVKYSRFNLIYKNGNWVFV